MRDSGDQMHFGQNSRAKFKQRIAGGAVLLIVLAIFLPFIFNHSHMGADSDAQVDNSHAVNATSAGTVAEPAATADQTQVSAINPNEADQTANQPVQATPAPETTAPAAVNPVAPDTSAAQENPAAASEQSMRSDQQGLTSAQSESTTLDATQPAPQQQLMTPEVNPQPASPAQAAPAAQATQLAPGPDQSNQGIAVQPEQAVVSQPLSAATSAQAIAHQALAKSTAPIPAKPIATRHDHTAASAPAWIIQVGSFTQPERAKQLAVKLRAQGLHAYTQREANHLTRVYVGPLASQHQAQKVQQQVQNQFQLNGWVREKR